MADPQYRLIREDDFRPYHGGILDIDTGRVQAGRILVQSSGGGYVALGFGQDARLLDFAFDRTSLASETDPFLAACGRIAEAMDAGGEVATRWIEMPDTLGTIAEPSLRRLVVAEALTKAGFNPEEPRDWRGRWTADGNGEPVTEDHNGVANTSRGRSEASAGSAAREIGAAGVAIDAGTLSMPGNMSGAAASTEGETAGTIFGELTPWGLETVTALAESFFAPAVFFGVFFIPTPTGDVVSGALPGHPNITYRFDGDERRLTLSQDGRPFYSGRPGVDGRFSDADSRIIGRDLGERIVLDANVLPSAALTTETEGRSGAKARPHAKAETDEIQPELCPSMSPENINGRSPRTVAYQQQISGLPKGYDMRLPAPLGFRRAVRFDGCVATTGTMLEAKGPGYLRFMKKDEFVWKPWFQGLFRMIRQMDRQSRAAVGRDVEWHFAERPVAKFFQAFAKAEQHRIPPELLNIEVEYTPPLEIVPHGPK